MHPNVIEPQNRGFTPTEAEVTDAKQVLKRYQALQRAGKIFEELDGRIIDVYEAHRAEDRVWSRSGRSRNTHDRPRAPAGY